MLISQRLSRRSDDDGFTLIELIVTITILGIIIVPLTATLITYFLNTQRVTARLSESHDVQVGNAYWQQDVASLGVRSSAFTANTLPLTASVWTDGSHFSCSTPAGSSSIIVFNWTDVRAPAAGANALPTQDTIQVNYVTQGTLLVRAQCKNGSLVGQQTLVHNLSTPAPSLACDGSTCQNGASTPPSSVSLTLNVKAAGNTGSAQQVVLSGQRRQT